MAKLALKLSITSNLHSTFNINLFSKPLTVTFQRSSKTSVRYAVLFALFYKKLSTCYDTT